MVGTAPSSSDCVAYWKLEDTTDSANSHTLTNNGATSGATGILDDCYSFDGSNDYITTPDTSDLDFGTGDFSVSIWIKPDTGTDGTVLRFIGKDSYPGSGTNYTGFFFQRDTDNQIWFATRNVISGSGPGNYYQSTTLVTSGSGWTHIVGVRKDNELFLYINGVLDGSLSESIATDIDNSVTLKIGAMDDDPTDRGWDGLLDEASVFNKALTADNVTYLYNGGTPGSAQQYPFSSGITYNAPFFGMSF